MLQRGTFVEDDIACGIQDIAVAVERHVGRFLDGETASRCDGGTVLKFNPASAVQNGVPSNVQRSLVEMGISG